MFCVMKKLVSILICHILYHVTYENIEQLNQYQRCLICPNHTNIFDPFFIFPKTNHLFIMAKSELFRNPLLSKIWYHYQVFPTKREKTDISGVRYVKGLFEKQDKIKLLMFPEGGILKEDIRRKKIKTGAVHLSASVKVSIIPIAITENPKLFHKVVVTLKEPIFPKEEVLESKQKLQETSNELLKKIYSL